MNLFKPKEDKESQESKQEEAKKVETLKGNNNGAIYRPFRTTKEQENTAFSTAGSENGFVVRKILPPIRSYKPILNKKLTILLIENTVDVVNEASSLNKIIQSLVTEGLVCIINYGSSVRKSEIFDASELKNKDFLFREDANQAACLADALSELEELVIQEYMTIKEEEDQKVIVKQIEVIGIGTCQNKDSKLDKDAGIDCFCRIVQKPQVVTKYFCLTEKSFINAAEIGFRSIGSISRSY